MFKTQHNICADITVYNDHYFYYDTSEATFKQHHRNHTRDFKDGQYQHSTELAKYIWQLRNKFNYSIKWSISSIAYGFANPLSCKLCIYININALPIKHSSFGSHY